MIVRENETTFICVEQDHHAHLSKEIIVNWQTTFLKDDNFKNSVLYAIEQHDVGWDHFDQQPLWNDAQQQPYLFTDLPILIKIVLYTNGINLVEKRDPYAAALCSKHYTEFLKKDDKKEVEQFVTMEETRRQSILQHYPEINEQTFLEHLSLLQLADHFSLFICLHDPGNNDQKHRYFQNGIRIPKSIDRHHVGFIKSKWIDEITILLEQIQEVEPFSITIKEKLVCKQSISEIGWLKSYESTPYTERTVQFTFT